jgi:hypothetical protein
MKNKNTVQTVLSRDINDLREFEKMKETMLFFIILFSLFSNTHAQYSNSTAQYFAAKSEETTKLTSLIENHPDVVTDFFPQSVLLQNNYYVYDYPDVSKYRIGLLVDPCRGNSYDCCMNTYGSAEYPALLTPGIEQDRVYKYIVIGIFCLALSFSLLIFFHFII